MQNFLKDEEINKIGTIENEKEYFEEKKEKVHSMTLAKLYITFKLIKIN